MVKGDPKDGGSRTEKKEFYPEETRLKISLVEVHLNNFISDYVEKEPVLKPALLSKQGSL